MSVQMSAIRENTYMQCIKRGSQVPMTQTLIGIEQFLEIGSIQFSS